MDNRADARHFGRRAVLGGASAALLASAASGTATAEDGQSANGPLSEIPIVLPRTELVYEAVFDLEPTMMRGQGPLGERRIVPISGGVSRSTIESLSISGQTEHPMPFPISTSPRPRVRTIG